MRASTLALIACVHLAGCAAKTRAGERDAIVLDTTPSQLAPDLEWGRADLRSNVVESLGFEIIAPSLSALTPVVEVEGALRSTLIAVDPAVRIDVVLRPRSDDNAETLVALAEATTRIPAAKWQRDAEGIMNGWTWVTQDVAHDGDDVVLRRYGTGSAGSYVFVFRIARADYERSRDRLVWLNLLRLLEPFDRGPLAIVAGDAR